MAKHRQKKNKSSNMPGPRPAGSKVDAFSWLIFLGLAAGLVGAVAAWQRIGDVADRVESRLGTIELQVSRAVRENPTNPAPVQQPQRRGPDPDLIHDVATAGAPTKGFQGAPVTIIEFSDFHCPFCIRVVETLDRVQAAYGNQVNIVWKHLPQVALHPQAPGAHVASVAAQRQGKFWEFHDKVFQNTSERSIEAYRFYARELGLDLERFEKDLVDPGAREAVEADVAEAQTMQITATPAFFINGRYLRGAKPFEDFARIINEELTRAGIAIPEQVQGL